MKHYKELLKGSLKGLGDTVKWCPRCNKTYIRYFVGSIAYLCSCSEVLINIDIDPVMLGYILREREKYTTFI